MSRYRITTPVEGYNGVSAGVEFTNGQAIVDEPPAYFFQAGYKMEPLEEDKPKSPTRRVKKAE